MNQSNNIFEPKANLDIISNKSGQILILIIYESL